MPRVPNFNKEDLVTTHEQDAAIERLSIENAGVTIAVTEGLMDGAIEVVLPDKSSHIIDRWGGTSPRGILVGTN